MNQRRWIATLLLLVVAGTVFAQRMTDTVQVTLVEVPVTVADRDGNAVSGLTSANFELYDEGKRVPIEYFEVLDIPKLTSQKQSVPLPPAATRHFLLLFDISNSSPGTIGRAAEAAKEFATQQLGERDLAAVATFTAEAGARMITNFTKDRVLLTNAIETLGNPSYFKVADPLMISAIRSGGGEGDAEAGLGGKSSFDAAYAELAREQERMAKRSSDSEMKNRLRIQFTNMGNVARVLDKLRGQKQIILLSEGFDARLIQGRENLGGETTRNEADTVMSGEIWNVDNEERFGSTSSSRDVSEMAQLFRRSDVVLHAIDIKGLRGNVDVASSGGSTRKSFESLHLITSPTGGTVFKNANDMRENFTSMLRQQEVVYLIGFSAKSTGKPGKFHTLKVKAVDVRGARVSHRAGYYEPSARISALERTLTLAEIMMTDAPIDDVAVTLGLTTLPGPGGKARVPVVVEVPGKRLLENVSGNVANAQLLLYAFNEDNRVVDFLEQKISLDLTKAGDVIRSGGLRYYGSMRLPPGKHALKALVRVEETGRIGFRRGDIDVPTFEVASVMPPVLFSEAGDWAMLVAPSRGDDYAYPFAAGSSKYIPRSNPDLAANQDYKVALFLYRVPLEDLAVTPTVVRADGTSQPAKVTLLGRTAADERGSVKLLFDFKPESIAAGSHQLRFDVKTKDGTQTVVSMPFTVR